MATIDIHSISKKFGDKWIFHNFSYQFFSNHRYGISGLNGSGKSTLLKTIAGYITPSQGQIAYTIDQKSIAVDAISLHISFIAPYIDIPTNYTLDELLKFHFNFRKRLDSINQREFLDTFQLPHHKPIHQFSSGMLQRVKLALAFLTDSKMILLDEPTETLDQRGFELYTHLLDNYGQDRLILIASNKEKDFYNTQDIISIENYKK